MGKTRDLFKKIRDTKVFPGGSEGKVSACNVGDQVSSLDREDPQEKEM